MKSKPETSPAGIAGWTCINKPSTKFKPDGEYSIKLLLPPDLAGPLLEKFKTAAEEAKAEFMKKDAKKANLIAKFDLSVPGSDELDADSNPTGNTAFQFKQTALIKPKDTKKDPFEVKIGIFDAKGKPLPSEVIVGRGSRVKVAYEVIPFCMAATKKVGVSLRLKAVQVLELVKYSGGGSADDYGFGEEDGYTQEESSGTFEAAAEHSEQAEGAKDGDF